MQRRAGSRLCRRIAAPPGRSLPVALLAEQFGELICHRAAEFLGIDDRHGAAVIARHIMAGADGAISK